ncbi:hypothetical protein CPB85DRAFT_1263887 [Mucidula mucida]|nr:hypothetical protein CPB85DRAFT_1263887 [Mucidula mucida]
MFSDMPGVVGPTEWITQEQYDGHFDAVWDLREMVIDALAILSETVGGMARQWSHDLILQHQKRHDSDVLHNYFLDLQAMLVLLMSRKEALTDTFRWGTCMLYMPSPALYHTSFTSNVLEGKTLFDSSPDRFGKDLAEVMRIAREVTSTRYPAMSNPLQDGKCYRSCVLSERPTFVARTSSGLARRIRIPHTPSQHVAKHRNQLRDTLRDVEASNGVGQIRSDISTTRLLTDLTNMQICLALRMEDICKGQKTTHRMLRTILVEVRGRRTGGAYIKEAD